MATIEILGVPHAYELTAPTSYPHTLVFIHGWLNSRGYWQPVISRLSDDFQCLCYDLRGFGESQSKLRSDNTQDPDHFSWTVKSTGVIPNPFDSFYTPAAYAQDLIVLLQQLNISSAWLIGHSLGGTIALWTASEMPVCVKGVSHSILSHVSLQFPNS
ncbi:hypothetical protein NUACC21_01190 [Scytonema sp. NUACC21]